MTRSKLFVLASLLAAGLLGPAAQAQQQQAPATPSTPGAPGQPANAYGGSPQGGPPPDQGGGPPAPVLVVTSIEVLRSDRNGGLDLVRVRGLTTSGAWSQPLLKPITRGEARDGILDLMFEASSPAGAQPLGPFMPVEALLPVETGHPYKGVRVRGGSNAVSLKSIPGYVEVTPPKEDCAKCLGKFFVPNGTTAPAGATADNSVREADLPWKLRVIKPTDGIPSYAVDPNRLTLVLSEDGRIIDAAWD
ncbi:hypothetical protein [Reyranella sp.]|uniref:hypothetical protein n=1 Tax=Reyranella sp. TaxID=1929291 RepID=UPI003BAD73F8